MKKKIIIIGGDPSSINSEIIFKSWKKIPSKTRNRIYLISNYELIKRQFNKLKYSIKLIKVQNINEKNSNKGLKIIDIHCKFKDPFKINKKARSKFVLNSLNYGHKIALDKKNISGVINCPIDKKLLNRNNFGVTEYYTSKCNIKDNSVAMLIYNKNLAVSPITTHIDIKNVPKNINIRSIVNQIKTVVKWYKSNHRVKPKIAILGLNPHNAESRNNTEEAKVILPAITKLKKLKINISGPFAADTVFINDFKNYDVIIGMYHDQVLSPFKALFKFDAINITLGLKYLRLSPDHGVATNLIGKNKANATSLIKCINFLDFK
jgi:4-hydroxy-L-threonine phosphate dehydrogenase PdxA